MKDIERVAIVIAILVFGYIFLFLIKLIPQSTEFEFRCYEVPDLNRINCEVISPKTWDLDFQISSFRQCNYNSVTDDRDVLKCYDEMISKADCENDGLEWHRTTNTFFPKAKCKIKSESPAKEILEATN